MKPSRIDALQALRAIAAVLVMLFHLGGFSPSFLGGEFAGNAFAHGEAGVDIFFVISGFIIFFSVKARSEMGRRQFFEARLVRLYPIYWLVMFALVAAELLGLSDGNPERLDAGTIARSFALSPSPDYILTVAWSLVIEVMFYLVFAAFFFHSERSFFIAMGLWSGAAVGARVVGFSEGPFWFTDYVLYSGVVEFLFGAVIARAGQRAGRTWGYSALALGSLSLMAAMQVDGPFAHFGREIRYGVPAALLVFGAVNASPPVPRWLSEIGEASYVLYLVHLTALSGVLGILRRVGLLDTTGVQATAWLGALATVLCSYAIHRLAEKPLLRWSRRKLQRAR